MSNVSVSINMLLSIAAVEAPLGSPMHISCAQVSSQINSFSLHFMGVDI